MFADIVEFIKRGFPILTWSRDYNIDKAVADFVAGITIGLTLIPQSIAYASLAGLGPEYGLYSSLCGGIIYVVFGTIPELNIAPTALVSLLTFSFTHNATYGNVNAAILLCFLSGIIELICGGLHLGFLIDFVSTPVVAGFTSAAALTIASSQVKNLLGLKFLAQSFPSVWFNVFTHIKDTKKWDAMLGILCCVILLLLRKLKDFGSPPLERKNQTTKKTSKIKKIIWFCSVARNAFVVIACSIAAYLLSNNNNTPPFTLTSQVPEGLPKFTVPFQTVSHGNVTLNITDMMKELGSGIFVIPFVSILGNVANAKAFAKGKVVDASQEMIAVGMCNLVSSFFGSYPINASFSRAAVSNASGVKTPLAGIYAGIMVILALTFLTPYFSYIPKATLAAVIICAVIFMVEVTITKMMWEINKIDLFPFIITLFSCLFLGIEIGILIGICVDLLFLLYTTARPGILMDQITNDTTQYIKITPTSSVLFPSAEYVREKIMTITEKSDNYKFIIVDCQRINKIDFTTAKCFSALADDFNKVDKQIIFYKPEKSVAKIIKKVMEHYGKIAESDNHLSEILKETKTNLPLTTVIENMQTNTLNKENTISNTEL